VTTRVTAFLGSSSSWNAVSYGVHPFSFLRGSGPGGGAPPRRARDGCFSGSICGSEAYSGFHGAREISLQGRRVRFLKALRLRRRLQGALRGCRRLVGEANGDAYPLLSGKGREGPTIARIVGKKIGQRRFGENFHFIEKTGFGEKVCPDFCSHISR